MHSPGGLGAYVLVCLACMLDFCNIRTVTLAWYVYFTVTGRSDPYTHMFAQENNAEQGVSDVGLRIVCP
jgi:hypothetical protein